MFNLGVSGLVAAYVLIAALLAGICIYCRGSWLIKGTLIVITTAFYLVTYFAFPQILGWPTLEQPPHRFRLLAAHVERPDKARQSRGAIYLWLVRIDDLSSPMVPRAYRFDYSTGLQERVLNASSKLNKGIAQLGEYEREGYTLGESGKNMSGSGAKSVNIIFYDLPDTMFPER